MNILETYYKKKIDTIDILNIDNAAKYKDNFPSKIVFLTGVTGQDGSHMADYLLKNTDYLIFGGVRRLSVYNHTNIKHIYSDRFILVNYDLCDTHSINKIMEKIRPDYFINFAAQSFVASSWDFPRLTWETNTTGVLDILESIRTYNPTCRFYQAGSSEEFGNVQYMPQDENHPLCPRSPYGASKAAARQLIKVYRESYNLYAIQGFLFNHEGTRRGEEFVTRKISKNVANIHKLIKNNQIKHIEPIELGNIHAKRDWSDAEDFIEGIWLMLNQNTPKEYVLSSNETHTIKEFVEIAFKEIGINGYWNDRDELYFSLENETICLVKINPRFYRPAEVDILLGDSTKARTELNWAPKSTFEELVKKMVRHDIKLLI